VSGYFWSSTGVPSEVKAIAVCDISAAVFLQAVVLEPCMCQWNPSGYVWSSTGVPSEVKAIAVCVQPLVERRENISGVRWQSFRWRFVFFIKYYNI
jgi:hypothetical protein